MSIATSAVGNRSTTSASQMRPGVSVVVVGGAGVRSCLLMATNIQMSYTDVQDICVARMFYTGVMSQREALLAGAKRCLLEKGYGSTTARDITEASGANLGSIGYHFGSKDRLLKIALLEVTAEWGDAVEKTARLIPGRSPQERLTALIHEIATRLPEIHDLHAVGIQSYVEAGFDDDLRKEISSMLTGARCELAALVLERDSVEPGSPEERGLGFLVYSLVAGMTVQVVIEPSTTDSPDLIADSLKLLTTPPG